MANTFSFDTKLNNYSKIALSLSGGIDSGLLLYYLIRAGYDVTCYTFIRDSSPEIVSSSSKNIVNFITKTLQNKFVREKPFKIKDHVFVSFSGELITSKRQAMNETYINLIKSRVIDCVVSGTTQHFIDDTNNEADPLKSEDVLWSDINVPIYRPFINFNKNWIKENCDANDLTSEIANLSVSCIHGSPPCKECLWCKEKYTAFGMY
jgi:7-cyano-7-deazaguanine synthase in queuosine biosynthesis